MVDPIDRDGQESFEDGDVTYIVSYRPRCRKCGQRKLKRNRTSDGGDETKTRKYVCLHCGAKIHEIVVG